jgi:hypothetical protein
MRPAPTGVFDRFVLGVTDRENPGQIWQSAVAVTGLQKRSDASAPEWVTGLDLQKRASAIALQGVARGSVSETYEKRVFADKLLIKLAPRAGLEPATIRLTVT